MLRAMEDLQALDQAVDWLRDADGMLVTAGAGMGIDSGLPDFRGEEGFWKAYPALKIHGLPFHEIANPAAMKANPRLAWGFYGHRLAMYRRTVPHRGFHILKTWGDRMARGSFVFTSNVDGHFQKAGFPERRVVEVHGTIHKLQCLEDCGSHVWSAEGFHPEIDEDKCQLANDLPKCPHCGAVARPNILMFGDWTWVDRESSAQYEQLQGWLGSVSRLVVVELGAGRAIPTVRSMSERNGPRVIRINPRESVINPARGIGIAGGALDVLDLLDARLMA